MEKLKVVGFMLVVAVLQISIIFIVSDLSYDIGHRNGRILQHSIDVMMSDCEWRAPDHTNEKRAASPPKELAASCKAVSGNDDRDGHHRSAWITDGPLFGNGGSPNSWISEDSLLDATNSILVVIERSRGPSDGIIEELVPQCKP